MTRLLLVVLTVLLTACASHEGVNTSTSAATTQHLNRLGEETAVALTERYNNPVSACRPHNPSAAFECSGVIIRGTSPSTQYHAWNPNPSGTGVSFSYLRKDIIITDFYIYKNGFIFYPRLLAPEGKVSVSILCFFPRDGATVVREDQGCGQSPNRPTSRECQEQGINTAERWVEHYNQYGSYSDMCGFNVREALGENATIAFAEGLKAQRLIFNPLIDSYNELRIAKWDQDIGDVLPLQAFFYLDSSGKAGAQYDQQDFLKETGILVPIILITLPATEADQATFQFIPEDQAPSLHTQR